MQMRSAIAAWKRVRFDDLLIEETTAALPADEQVAQVLAATAAEHLERVLPPEDTPAGLYLTRVRCLREWMPELELPAFDESDLHALLPWLCPGRRSFAELRNADWLQALQGRLTHAQRQTLEREAPERLLVPSGSRVALRYEVGRPPVLAVRIQEMFGLRDTPRVAGGRIRVLLHLLAPRTIARSKSPTTSPASGRTPIRRCARNCVPAIPNTPGRKIRGPRPPSAGRAANARNEEDFSCSTGGRAGIYVA